VLLSFGGHLEYYVFKLGCKVNVLSLRLKVVYVLILWLVIKY